MKRSSVQTVTLPILIESEARDADDWKTFLVPTRRSSLFVHEVRREDARQWAKELSARDADILAGLGYFKIGFDDGDEYSLMNGYEKLQLHIKDLIPPDEWVKEVQAKNGMKIRIQSGGGQKWLAAAYNYSLLLTQMFKNTRFVMWYSREKYKKKMLPALYCRDRKTAVFAMRLMGPLRLCALCGAPFISTAQNVECCCKEHSSAYRVARFRWNKKINEG